ncbi:MAG TPA: pyridoxamine 5'-phosphate oxidase family protein, partial [Nevskiaceae bacterium]|nr:pyridoxamine 5'-phosphate oxidase family protein [Nevskiaceae bacterium]
ARSGAMSPPYLRRKPRGQRLYSRATEAPMHDGPSREESLQQLRPLIEDIAIATLTTIDEDGGLRSRPMATQSIDDDGVLWFFTNDYAPKVAEVLLHPEVCVTYADPARQRYVSVSGKAELVREHEEMKRRWQPELQAWFPHGLEEQDLGLLRIEIEHAQYWDAGESRLVQLFARARAALTGAPPPAHAGNGTAHKLTLKTRIAPDNIS